MTQSFPMTTRHTTEDLARKAARRLGRELVQIIETPGIRFGQCDYHGESGVPESVLAPEERLVYKGPGYACPREVS